MKTLRNRRRKGANLLEGALVFMTVLGMVLFVLDMGRVLVTQQFITERVRTTLRQAVVNKWTTDQTKNVLVFNSTTNTGDSKTPGFMGLTTGNVTVTDAGLSPDYLQVSVSKVSLSIWIPYIAGSYTLPTISLSMPLQSNGATD